MRLLVCGGRDYNDAQRISFEIAWLEPTVVIQGGARGADTHARIEAQALGIEVITYRADWERYGRGAGHIRNAQMLKDGRPDMVLAFPGGRGTADMVRRARKAGVEVLEVT